jgi:hypothetical protein
VGIVWAKDKVFRILDGQAFSLLKCDEQMLAVQKILLIFLAGF